MKCDSINLIHTTSYPGKKSIRIWNGNGNLKGKKLFFSLENSKQKGSYIKFWCVYLPAEHVICDMNDTSEYETTDDDEEEEATQKNIFKCAMILYLVISILFLPIHMWIRTCAHVNLSIYACIRMGLCVCVCKHESVELSIVKSCIVSFWSRERERERNRPIKLYKFNCCFFLLLLVVHLCCHTHIKRK